MPPLATQGRTDFALVPPPNPSPIEQAALADLQRYLQEITGAEFPMDPNAPSPRIIVGRRPPEDTKPFEPRERRVKSSGGDLYLYGEGEFGNAFSVYDFLEHFLGCRWFDLWGSSYMPRLPEVVLGEIDYAVVPSFLTVEAGGRNRLLEEHPEAVHFFRRRRMFVMPGYSRGSPDCGWHYVGPPIHAMSAYVPPGGHEPGLFVGGWAGPHELFADKAYFETHPEFFTMDESGNRVPMKLLCFSNQDLRRTYIENMEKVIAHEGYDPATPGVISLDVNDKGGPFCACPECGKLVEQYGAVGGPYYDFLLELSPYFAEKYPLLVLRFLAYGLTMTEIPPVLPEPLPENLVPFFAALWTDFSKPLNHPVNQASYENFSDWSRVSSRMWLWLYPCTYNWPSWNVPLVANGFRLAEDLRTAHAFGTRMVLAEFGGSVIDNMAFKPLWIYLLSRLSEDITLDEQDVIQEFMEGYYGNAAPLMLAYFNELEKLQIEEPNYLRYCPDPRVLSYTTPANVLRWQSVFDRMEDLVRDRPDHLLNVRRARLNLDAITVHRWPGIQAEFPGTEPGVEAVYRRHIENLEADFEQMFSAAPETPEMARFRQARFAIVKGGGIDRFYAQIQEPIRPLPETFAREHEGKTIHRVRPDLNRQGLRATQRTPAPDDEGAFGIALRGRTTSGRIAFDVWRQGELDRITLEPRVLRQEVLESAPPGYHLYPLGRITLSPDCQIRLRVLDDMFGLFVFGHLLDPDNPEQEYDLYIGLRYEPPGLFACDQMVLVEAGP